MNIYEFNDDYLNELLDKFYETILFFVVLKLTS